MLVQRLRQQGHRENVTSLSFSADSLTLVSGSDDKTAIVWSVEGGCVFRRLTGHHSQVDNIAYSPNGALIVTSDLKKSVKTWDASTGACLDSFVLEEYMYQLTFSPDSSRLCIRARNSSFIYDVQSHKRLAVLQRNTTDRIGLSMSHQGDRVVTGTDTGRGVKISNVATGQELLTIDDGRELLTPVAFSPDSAEVLATCVADKTALAYDSRTGQLRRTFKLSHLPYRIAYSPNGDYVAFVGRRGSLEVYGARSGTFIGKVEGFGDNADIQKAEFLPDNQTILYFFGDIRESLRLCNIYDLVRMR
ncbi:uncharacterized protein PHACADRAFT_248872 [Phanerochaete carnosa HHB-10118-sp]|uniref:Uncharacterized protein n=1 Tax=Phanerochaete carnosa (strain HHB-10118-sp) TaxID=650164 RepID=K5X7D2_PHACS|nr:uncharacterized protein PHACADRAFT_248872 [Phanerochaete carnosa HHB-10118-sp]EKM58782.1 hypothetical protein PHACADRAFT_248872 [Phanerochaete carnosa HHB-10118-sp]